jgi:hypothetical protein
VQLAELVKDGAKDLRGIEQIPKADLLIVFARRLKLPDEQIAVVRKHWESGKPVIGIRTASHAFSNEDNAIIDREVMGGNYQGHFGGDPVNVSAVGKAVGHLVLKGVGAIVSTKRARWPRTRFCCRTERLNRKRKRTPSLGCTSTNAVASSTRRSASPTISKTTTSFA